MKKLTVCLILTAIAILASGCIDSRPPEYQVSNPYAVPDGSGGVVVAYQVNNGQEMHTYIQRLDAQGKSLWGKRGVDLGSRSGGFGGEQGDFTALVRDPFGNITVVYYLNGNIWARKLDMDGHPAWEGETTKRVSPTDIRAPAYFKAIGNRDGETIIAWVADNDHISIQKADSNIGYFTSISTPDVDRFDIAGDYSGNVFILWKDNPSYSEGNIFVQKVDASGQAASAAWQAEGLQLTDARNPGLARADLDRMIISDGSGGAVVIWVQGTLSEDGKLIIGQDLRAQHIGSEGDIEWGENGMLIAGNVHDPGIVGDAPDNITVSWSDLQNVYAQKMDITGKTVWDESGINIGKAGERNNVIYYYAANDNRDGNIIVWNYSESGNKTLRAQRVDASGNKVWGDNGVGVSSVSPYWGGYATPAQIIPDGNGGFFVTWAAGEHLKDKTSSYIQKISGDGEALWGEEGIELSQ